MVRSPGFGSTAQYIKSRAVNPRFHYGSVSMTLNLHCTSNSLDRSTKSTPSHPKMLRLLVGTEFQVLFHSPPGVLFTFPSRYSFTIDHVIYLALEGGPPSFSQGFPCPALLKTSSNKDYKVFEYATFTLFGGPFQAPSSNL